MLEPLGVPLRSMEIELGPGQIELTFAPTSALRLADEAVVVRAALKQVARRNGMIATFMSRPPGPDSFPSGWHLHQSLLDVSERNMLCGMSDGPAGALSATGRHWIAGLRSGMELPPLTASPYRADAGPLLPRTLGEAIERFGASTLYRSVWGDEVVEYLTRLKSSEWNRFLAAVTDWEQREYFELF